MRKAFTIFSVFVLATLSLAARGPAQSNTHSNAPAASTDRDKGTDRASDVGKGKHKGLAKKHKKQSKHS